MDSLTELKSGKSYTLQVSAEEHKMRIDLYLTAHYPRYSRSFFQKLIDQSCVKINGIPITRPGIALKENDTVELSFPLARSEAVVSSEVDKLKITIVYQHDQFFIINKPAGIMVHPAASTPASQLTLTDWITKQHVELSDVGSIERPGIVHRLDKDTSGLLIIPRTNYAHAIFGDLFKERLIQKTYYAIVEGTPPAQGSINFSIDRDHRTKTRMSYFKPYHAHARTALTHYRTMNSFKNAALLELKPVTGRTHQIRVHCMAIGNPIIGDALYGSASSRIARQALHAGKISFTFENESFSFDAPLPADMSSLLTYLQQTNAQ